MTQTTEKKPAKKKTKKKAPIRHTMGSVDDRVTKPVDESKFYVRNHQLIPEIRKSKANGRVTEELGRMLMLIAKNYVRKNFFSSYTNNYREDMVGKAIEHLAASALKFDEGYAERTGKKPNPFAYYTQCCKNAFRQTLKQEKRQRIARDALNMHLGLDPSWTYAEAWEEEYKARIEAEADNEAEHNHEHLDPRVMEEKIDKRTQASKEAQAENAEFMSAPFVEEI